MEKKFKLVDEDGKEIDISCLPLTANTKYLFMANVEGLSEEGMKYYLDGLQNVLASLLGNKEFVVAPTIGNVGKIQKIDL